MGLMMSLLVWLGVCGALPPEPRHQQDFTAYTVGRNRWRVGSTRLDYGLLDNLSVGINPAQWALGPNIYTKVTAVQTRRVDASIRAGAGTIYDFWIQSQLGEGSTFQLNIFPVSVRGSLIITPKWSVHLGTTSVILNISGSVEGDQLLTLLDVVTGSEVLNEELIETLGGNTYADASARINFQQSNFAVEYRRNRRNSFILESNSYVAIGGLISGGVGSTVGEGGEASVGVGADFFFPLSQLPSASTVSYQWSWERFNLRLGLPLTFNNPLSYLQAIKLYWLLGPQPEPRPI